MAKKQLQLGRPSPIPSSPDRAILDRVPNPHAGTNYIARFMAPEFTTLCPITGQPDFAHLVIDYLPARYLVEIQIIQALPQQLSQPRGVPRRLHGGDREKVDDGSQAEVVTDRRILVSARWNADRCILANREIAERRLGAGSRRRALSRPRLGRRDLPAHLQCADPSRYGESDCSDNQHRVDADAVEPNAVNHRPRCLAQKEEHGVCGRRRAAC